jgi:hypothetical protein
MSHAGAHHGVQGVGLGADREGDPRESARQARLVALGVACREEGWGQARRVTAKK